MKIMLYCQHVLGIGHFFRSMEVARALDRHEVLFVEGGDPLDGFTPPHHVKRSFLPPLMMDAEFSRVESRLGDVEAIKNERRQLLMSYFLGFSPDVLLIELFPFGRKQFHSELMPVLEMIQAQGLPVGVVCSLRDILVEKEDRAAYEERVLGILNTCFHLLLVHADPRVISLAETFERVSDIRIPFHYTGFVAREAPARERFHENRVIVASSGGGKVGTEVLASTVSAVRRMPDDDLRLRVFLGPYMESADRALISDLASPDSRISLCPFSTDFLRELAKADLSISMAGYNTCMDILSARVKALVYPFPQNREQQMRAEKLEKLGLLTILRSLETEPLALTIQNALENRHTTPSTALDLNGSRNTARAIEKHFEKH